MPNEILRGVSHADYHSGNLPGAPHLSRSVAMTLLQRSPLHAWHQHPQLGGAASGLPTKAMDHGSLVHELLLGEGSGYEIVYIHANKNIGPKVPATDYRTDRAQAERDRIREAGRVPVLADQLSAAQTAADCLRTKLEQLGVPLAVCDKEITLVWEEGGVSCKARMDLLWVEGGRAYIWDLKFPDPKGQGTPYDFQRSIPWKWYDVQAHVYQHTLGLIHPELAGRIDFEFLWCETWGPAYDIATIPVSASQLDVGRMKWERALKKWRECMSSGIWPGYGRLEPIEAPSSAMEAEFSAVLAATPEPAWMGGDDNG